jgi:predicted transcriptional regulator of viral defense system
VPDILFIGASRRAMTRKQAVFFVCIDLRLRYLLYMRLEDVVKLAGAMPCFDLALLAQSFDDRRNTIRVQLSRWMAQGRVIGLRRGMYTLSEAYRRVPLTPAVLANQLYRPSYLSGLWALGHHDLIPERVVWFTSVTPRVPRRFENPFGVFVYRNIKQDCFFGFASVGAGGQEFLVAEPEKALLDHWHLTGGEWTEERLDEMRYQNVGRINAERLELFAKRYRSPRLERAVQRWHRLVSREEQGTVTL